MFGNMSIQTIFIVLIGAAVFVLGTSNLRACLRLRRKGALITGKVMNARLVEKRDPQGKLIQHYYELTLSCHEGNNKTFQQKLNSTRQYEKGEEKCRKDHTVKYRCGFCRNGICDCNRGNAPGSFPGCI